MRLTRLLCWTAWLSAILALTGCSKQAREQRLLTRAETEFSAGEFDAAEVEYRGALQLVRDPKALGHLGILYLEEGRPIQAFPCLKAAAELSPDEVEVRIKLGLAYLQLGKPKDAREAAKRALTNDTANTEALLLLAESDRTKQDAAQTREFVEELRRGHPDCAGYHLALGMVMLDQTDLIDAESELRKAVQLDPKSSEAFLALGDLCALRRDARQAGDYYKTAALLAPARSSARLRYVDYLLATGKPDAAKKELTEIAQRAPDYLPAQDYAMRLALAERKYAECDGLIQTLLQRDPQNIGALLDRGVLKLAQREPDEAIVELKKAEAVYAHSPQIEFQLSVAYLRTGDLAKAENCLNQAVLFDPGFDQAKMALAELNLRKGNPAAAAAMLPKIIQRHPQLDRAYLLLARAYIDLKNPDEALETYRRMATVLPKDPQVPYFAGLLLAQRNQQAAARAAFEKSLQIDPSFGPALDMLLNEDLTEQHVDAASARVRALIEKYPKSAAPWLLQAKVDLVRNNQDATESDLLKAIDLDPTAQAAYFELTQVYIATHKAALAVEKLKTLADKTQSPRALMQLGLLHSSLNEFEAARGDYERLLSSNPKFGPALINLALLYSEHLGRLDRAYDLAKRAWDSAPDDAEAADTLGWILFRRGDYPSALDLAQECVQKEPGNIRAQYHLGMIHYMLGEEDSARQAFQHAVAGASADVGEVAAEARHRLELLGIDPAVAGPAVRTELEQRLRDEPNDPVARVRLAANEMRTGAATQAAKDYEVVLARAPRSVPIIATLVQLYTGPVPNLRRARELAKKAHELAPNDPQDSAALGRILWLTGDYAWSLDLLQQAALAQPDRVDLAYDLALGYCYAGRVSEAQSALRPVLASNTSAKLLEKARRLASMLSAIYDPADARAAWAEAREVLATEPGNIPASMVAALIQELQGDYQGASLAYENILRADSIFAPAARQLTFLYAEHLGNDRKAEEMGTRSLEILPNDTQLANELGRINYRLTDFAAAARFLEQSLVGRGNDAETFYYLGMAQYELKDFVNTKINLQRAMDLNLSAPKATQAKRVLADLNRDSAGGTQVIGH